MKLTNTADIYEMMIAYAGSAALNAALELGLFWMRAQQPDTADGIARTLEIPPHRCRYWLEVLDVHSREAWSFRAAYWQEQYPSVIDLLEARM